MLNFCCGSLCFKVTGSVHYIGFIGGDVLRSGFIGIYILLWVCGQPTNNRRRETAVNGDIGIHYCSFGVLLKVSRKRHRWVQAAASSLPPSENHSSHSSINHHICSLSGQPSLPKPVPFTFENCLSYSKVSAWAPLEIAGVYRELRTT